MGLLPHPCSAGGTGAGGPEQPPLPPSPLPSPRPQHCCLCRVTSCSAGEAPRLGDSPYSHANCPPSPLAASAFVWGHLQGLAVGRGAAPTNTLLVPVTPVVPETPVRAHRRAGFSPPAPRPGCWGKRLLPIEDVTCRSPLPG